MGPVAFLGVGAALWWLDTGAPSAAWMTFGGALLAGGVGWATHTFRRLRGVARYPAVIHRRDARGEGGWFGVVAVALPDGSVAQHPLSCWAVGPRRRRASPVVLQAADGHLLRPGEPTSLAVRAILATWMARYSVAGLAVFFGATSMLASTSG